MSEQEFVQQLLTVIETLRDAEKVREEDVTDEFVAGYEQALDDLAAWLREEFELA